MPIPLAVLAAWELRIQCQQSSLLEVVTLGRFLIATMASLRFRDLLRSKPDYLVSRATSYEVFPGLFLEALQIDIDKSREHWGLNWSPDSVLPSWAGSVPFSSPRSYHHALALIRFYCQCNWLSPVLLTPEQASNLSTQSMKSTLLAAAGQPCQTGTSQKISATLLKR